MADPTFDFQNLPTTDPNALSPVEQAALDSLIPKPTPEELAAKDVAMFGGPNGSGIAPLPGFDPNGGIPAVPPANIIKIPDTTISAGTPPPGTPPAPAPGTTTTTTVKTTAPKAPAAPATVELTPNATGLPDPNKPLHQNTNAEDAASIGQQGIENARELGQLEEKNAENRVNELLSQRQAQNDLARIHDQAYNQSIRNRDEARNEVKNFKFHDFWEGKSTGSFLMSRLGIVLGGLSIDGPTKNEALEQMGNSIKQDFDQQKINLQTKQQLAADASTDVTELQKRFVYEDARLEHQQASALNALAAQAQQLTSKLRGKIGENDAAKVALELQQAAKVKDDAALKNVSDLATAVETRNHLRHQNGLLDAQAFHARQAGKAAGANATTAKELQGETYVDKEGTKRFGAAALTIVAKDVAAKSEAEELVNFLKSNKSALAGTLGLDKIAALANKGKATQVLYKNLHDSQGNLLGNAESVFDKWISGNQGAKNRANLMKVAQEEVDKGERAIARHKKELNTGFAGVAKVYPEAVKNWINARTGGELVAKPTGEPHTNKQGMTVYLQPNGAVLDAQGQPVKL